MTLKDKVANRELCKKGCKEWIPWYRDKKGKVVYGCRFGLMPEKRKGKWYCPSWADRGLGETLQI